MEVASSGMAGFEFLRGLFVPKTVGATVAPMPAPQGASVNGAPTEAVANG
jgi:hypothetical protein